MPARDEQDYELRRQQIIDGALEVFASKGFESATNKDIAQAAGVGSPGLIYHYFKDKADLFRQVIEQRAPFLRLIDNEQQFMDRPPREVLTFFAGEFIKLTSNRANVALMRLMLGEALRRPAVANMLNQVGPGRGFEFITHYLAQQIERGTIRRIDPAVAARMFIGPLLTFVLTREVFVQPDAHMLSSNAMIQTTVDVFLRGLAPDQAN